MPLRSLTPSPTSSAMSETKKRTHVKLLYPTPVELRASVGKIGQVFYRYHGQQFGHEGRFTKLSTTGTILTVRDREARKTYDVVTDWITSIEYNL
jgi:hypothetical protein